MSHLQFIPDSCEYLQHVFRSGIVQLNQGVTHYKMNINSEQLVHPIGRDCDAEQAL